MPPCSRRSSRLLAATVAVVSLAAAGSAPAFADDSKPQLQLKAEGLYWRATGADVNYVQPVFNSPSPGATDVQFGFKPGYRLEADYGRWYVSWLDYSAAYDSSASCSTGGACFLDTANTFNFVNLSAGAVADSQLRLQLLDIGTRAPLFGEAADAEYSGGASFGLRHLLLYDNAHVNYSTGIDNVVHARDSLYGMRVGVDGTFRPGAGWSLSALAAVSLLDGQAEGDAFSTAVPINNTRRINTMVTGYEMSLKAEHAMTAALRGWIAYDFMQFQNLVTAPGIFNSSGVPQANQNMGFTGPRFGVGWSFN